MNYLRKVSENYPHTEISEIAQDSLEWELIKSWFSPLELQEIQKTLSEYWRSCRIKLNVDRIICLDSKLSEVISNTSPNWAFNLHISSNDDRVYVSICVDIDEIYWDDLREMEYKFKKISFRSYNSIFGKNFKKSEYYNSSTWVFEFIYNAMEDLSKELLIVNQEERKPPFVEKTSEQVINLEEKGENKTLKDETKRALSDPNSKVTALLEAPLEKISLDNLEDMFLNEENEKEVRDFITLLVNVDKLKKFGGSIEKWYLLQWEAGTWKKLIMKHIAFSWKKSLNCYDISLQSFDSSDSLFYTLKRIESETNLDSKHWVIFIKDLTELIKWDGDNSSKQKVSIVLDFIDKMENNITFIIPSEFSRESLNSKILDSWRFGWDVKLEKPNKTTRAKIFESKIVSKQKSENNLFSEDIDFQILWEFSNSMTPAQIEKLINDTISSKFLENMSSGSNSQITTKDFIEKLKK